MICWSAPSILTEAYDDDDDDENKSIDDDDNDLTDISVKRWFIFYRSSTVLWFLLSFSTSLFERHIFIIREI